jgi:hypothetical protein
VTKELKDGHVFSKYTSNYQTGSYNISDTEYDAVTCSYKNSEYNYLNYRIPNSSHFAELLNNTT